MLLRLSDISYALQRVRIRLAFVLDVYFIIVKLPKMFYPKSMINLETRRTSTCFIIVITLLQLSNCQTNFLSLLEGDQAYLIFNYSCGIYELILQAGNRAPFYHSGDEGLLLPPNQEHRFLIKVMDTNNSICLLNLTILDVQRYDAGTYTCFVYKDTETLQEFEQIGVHVDFPPGKVSCGVIGPNQAGIWVSLECEAPVGSLSGQIACYQNGERTPSLTPIESNISLKQTVLIKKTSFAVCCSSTFKQPKERCECCDTMIDPIYNKQVAGPKDMCFDTKPDEGLTTSSLGPAVDSDGPETTSHLPTTATQPSDSGPNILVICLSVFASIIVLCIGILAAHRRNYLCISRSRRTPDGVDYGGVPTKIEESKV